MFWLNTLIALLNLMKPIPSTHGDKCLGFIEEICQGHGKVIWRSQQGQIISKRVKIAYNF